VFLDKAHLSKLKLLAVVAGGVLILDQVTKALILKQLPLGGRLTVVPGFFDITHVHNPGGAFGFLAAMSAEVRSLLFVAVSLLAAGLIVYFYWQTPARHRLLAFGLALVFGGAVGNLLDRIRLGIVVDFLDVYIKDLHWPAFNVADSAITVGVFIFAFYLLFRKTRPDS
jgi:signal peptidase II